MVLPPTGLTTLLGAAGRSPDALVATLIEHGCLTSAARRSPERLRALIAGVIEAESVRRPMPGPSTIDMIARALRDAGVLSEKGRRLDGAPPRAPWWIRWRDAIADLTVRRPE
jgi:hypothetical protein